MSINSITVGGVVSEIKAGEGQRPTKFIVQTPVTKHDGTQGTRYTSFDMFNGPKLYVGAAVLVNAAYRQTSTNDKRDFKSLVVNRVQFTGSKEKPVVIPIIEAEICGNISSDLRKVGENGGIGYSVALNDYKKAAQPGAQAEVMTSFVNVVDYTGASSNYKKGQLVFLKGSFSQSSYTNKDGQKVYTTDFNVRDVVNTVPAFDPLTKATPASQPQPESTAESEMSIPAEFGQPEPAVAEPAATDGFMDVDSLGIDFSTWN